ncbi:MAG: hypothetical protein ABR907_06605 [Terracidiphilus sp.]|jgi:hypothetical protein
MQSAPDLIVLDEAHSSQAYGKGINPHNGLSNNDLRILASGLRIILARYLALHLMSGDGAAKH